MTTWLSSTAPQHPENEAADQIPRPADPTPPPADRDAWHTGASPQPGRDATGLGSAGPAWTSSTGSFPPITVRSKADYYYGSTGETPAQRLDRNYGEILQEVRVAQTGVQLLLAFLLMLAFTPRFDVLTAFQRDVYVASLVLGAAATALLIAPTPFHRLVFRRQLKQQLVKASSRFAFFGVTLLMLALSSSMLLILDVVVGADRARWITGGTMAWFGLWWYVAPLWTRLCSRWRKRRAAEHGAHRRTD